jgi:hypothetical protein
MATKLAAVLRELPFELLDHSIQRRVDVVARPLRSKHVAGGVARDLDPVTSVDPWIPLADDLDLQPGYSWIDPAELGQFTFGNPSDLVGEPNPSALEHELQSLLLLRSAFGSFGLGGWQAKESPRGSGLLPG